MVVAWLTFEAAAVEGLRVPLVGAAVHRILPLLWYEVVLQSHRPLQGEVEALDSPEASMVAGLIVEDRGDHHQRHREVGVGDLLPAVQVRLDRALEEDLL